MVVIRTTLFKTYDYGLNKTDVEVLGPRNKLWSVVFFVNTTSDDGGIMNHVLIYG